MADNNASLVLYTMEQLDSMTSQDFINMNLKELDEVLLKHGLTPEEVQGLKPRPSVTREKTAMCTVCKCHIALNPRTTSRHITSVKHRYNLADRLGIDIDELELLRVECQYCKHKLSILRKDALKRHEAACRVTPIKPRVRRKKDKAPKPKRLTKKERAALSRSQPKNPTGVIKLEVLDQQMNHLWTISEEPEFSASTSRATAPSESSGLPSGGFGCGPEVPTATVKPEPSDQVMDHLWEMWRRPEDPPSSAPNSRATTPHGSLDPPSDGFDYSSMRSSPLTELSSSPDSSRAPTPCFIDETGDPSGPTSSGPSIVVAGPSPPPSVAPICRALTPSDPSQTGESVKIGLETGFSSERLSPSPHSTSPSAASGSRAATPLVSLQTTESHLGILGNSFPSDRLLPIPSRLHSASPSPTSSSRAQTPYEPFHMGENPPDLKDPGPSSRRLPSIATFDSETLDRFMWNRSSLEILKTISAQDD